LVLLGEYITMHGPLNVKFGSMTLRIAVNKSKVGKQLMYR